MDPTLLIVIGVIVEIVLGVLLWRTGRGVYLAWMGVVLLGVAAGLLMERLIVTDRKLVLARLDEARDAARDNNLARLEACIAPAAAELHQWAKAVMGRVRFSKVNLTDVEIQTIDARAVGPTARVKLTGTALFDDRRGEIPHGGYSSRFTVDLIKVGSQWLVSHVVDENRDKLPQP